jgi:hypothetical protein
MMIERKPMLHLLPPSSLYQIAQVLEFGASKYAGPWAWTDGRRNWSEHYDAMQRHALAWWAGENADPETGCSPLAHVGARVLILLELERSGRGLDNRPTGLLSKP